MRRLVIAPHMDDESLGCGGLLAKHRGECTVVTVADSGPTRAAEHAEAMALLGVTDVRTLGLPDGHVHEHVTELVTALDRVIDEVRPDELYLPFPSLHQDHVAVYEGGMRACRISMGAKFYPPAVLVYDIAVYDLSLYPTDLRWNVFEALTEEQVAAKAAACAAYRSETTDGPHPMTSVTEIAAAVGRIRLLPYAEQYALVRALRP